VSPDHPRRSVGDRTSFCQRVDAVTKTEYQAHVVFNDEKTEAELVGQHAQQIGKT